MDETERDQRIKARAFELWQAEGFPEGRALENWTQAEREIDGPADADEDAAGNETGVIVAGEDARLRLSGKRKPMERDDPDYPKEPTDHAKLVAGEDAHRTPGYGSDNRETGK